MPVSAQDEISARDNESRGRISRNPLMNGDMRGQDIRARLEVFTIEAASSYAEHVAFSSKLPSPMGTGSRILPQDVQGDIRAITGRESPRIVDFRRGQLDALEAKARRLLAALRRIRENSKLDRCGTGARLHIPLLKEPL